MVSARYCAGLLAAALLTIAQTLRAASASPPPSISVPDILEVTDISGLAASPDGKMVAFRTIRASTDDNAYHLEWYVMPIDHSIAPRRIGNGGGALLLDNGWVADQVPLWSPGSDALYYRALVDGQVQIWRAPVDGSGAVAITHDAANVQDFTLDASGTHIRYQVAATRAEIDDAERDSHDDGVLIDASVDIAQPVSRGMIIDGLPASQRLTGQWFGHGNILWKTPVRKVTIALHDRIAGPASGSAVATKTDAGVLPTSAIVITRVARRNQLSVTLADGSRLSCPTAECAAGNVDTALPLPDGAILVTTSDPAEQQTLSVWRPGQDHGRIVARTMGLFNGGRQMDMPCAIGAAALVCVESAAVSPPRLVTLDLQSRRQAMVYDPNASLRDRIAPSARLLSWNDGQGSSFTGKLILPSTQRPDHGFPMVMAYYDCPGFLRGGLGDELPMLPLASRGVAALCINAISNPTGISLNAPANYAQALRGITAIVNRLGAEGLIDRRHVGMWGLSYGSEITMMMAERSSLLSAAAIATGQLEAGFYWINGVRGRDTDAVLQTTWRTGGPDADPAAFKRMAPALNTDLIRAPLLIQAPEQEARWMMELYARLSRSPTPVEMFAFANEPHNKYQPRHKLAVYDRNLDWFRFWLQDYVDPAPQKAAQFARWDALSARSKALASTTARAANLVGTDQPRP